MRKRKDVMIAEVPKALSKKVIGHLFDKTPATFTLMIDNTKGETMALIKWTKARKLKGHE